ncbi:hypothetical protein GCM10010452_32060 [Crossiella cryophila]
MGPQLRPEVPRHEVTGKKLLYMLGMLRFGVHSGRVPSLGPPERIVAHILMIEFHPVARTDQGAC